MASKSSAHEHQRTIAAGGRDEAERARQIEARWVIGADVPMVKDGWSAVRSQVIERVKEGVRKERGEEEGDAVVETTKMSERCE